MLWNKFSCKSSQKDVKTNHYYFLDFTYWKIFFLFILTMAIYELQTKFIFAVFTNFKKTILFVDISCEKSKPSRDLFVYTSFSISGTRFILHWFITLLLQRLLYSGMEGKRNFVQMNLKCLYMNIFAVSWMRAMMQRCRIQLMRYK